MNRRYTLLVMSNERCLHLCFGSFGYQYLNICPDAFEEIGRGFDWLPADGPRMISASTRVRAQEIGVLTKLKC